MFTHVWKKYLPIIRIIMKRAVSADQVLDLNKVDFEKAGGGRKAGYKFMIELTRGTVANVISGMPMATDLAQVLLADEVVKQLLRANNYEIGMNTRFQLLVKVTSPNEVIETVDSANSGADQPVSEN